jgi:hypothetical protein
MYRKIQYYKKRGFSKAEVVRSTELDWKTVRKYYPMSEQEYSAYSEAVRYRTSCFEPYRESIIDCFKLAGLDSLQKSSVYDFLEEKYGKLSGSERAFRDYLEMLVETGVLKFEKSHRPYHEVAPLPFGQQLQLDFGEYTTRSGLKLYIFASVLSASRYKYVVLQDHPFTTRDVISHLLDCFQELGGVPAELVIDQDHLLVVSENLGDVLFTKDFSQFIGEMGIKMFVCRKADPETKGKVENLVKFVKRNFLDPRNLKTLEDAQIRLRKWLGRRANGRESAATKRIPAILLEEERKHLRPLKASIFQDSLQPHQDSRKVSKTGMISVKSVKYPVPQKYSRKEVRISMQADRILVLDPDTGCQIVEHKKALFPGVIAFEPQALKEEKLELLEREMEELQDFPEWKEIIRQNRKAYPRHFRDQARIIRRHLTEQMDKDLLMQAVLRCLEDKSCSMNDVADVYTWLVSEKQKASESSPIELEKFSPKAEVQNLTVANRNLSEYQKLVTGEEAA